MRLPDLFQDQDKPELQYAQAGLDADAIVDTVLKALRYNEASVADGARA
jgi:1-deoxy-D-xylulose-5-phosphate synthase